MFLEEPKVEFVAINPEVVTTGSAPCSPSNPYSCVGEYVTSGVVTCSCSDDVYAAYNLPDCNAEAANVECDDGETE